jgi:RHS repeat-associated protein
MMPDLMCMTSFYSCSVVHCSAFVQDSTGKERDETGLDYFGARYYSGALGRFTSPDEFTGGIVDPFTGQPISQPGPLPYADITNPQTLNKYAYVMNNPLRYTDPDGHIAVMDDLVALGIAATVAYIGYQGYQAYKATVQYFQSRSSGQSGSSQAQEQGRDEKGRFLPTQPGQTKPGAADEQKGLDAVGATKNTKPLPNGKIPDGNTADGQKVEVKSGGTIANTEQVREMAKGTVDATGKPLILVPTNPNATITKPVKQNPNIIIKKPNEQ